MILSRDECLRVQSQSLDLVERDVSLCASAHGAEAAGGARVLRGTAPHCDGAAEVGAVWVRPSAREELLQFRVRIERVEQVSCAENGGRLSRGGRGRGVLFAFETPRGRFEAAVVEVLRMQARHSPVRDPQLQENVIHLARLTAVPECV